MDTAKICAFGIMCAIVCVLIKHYRAEFSIPARLGSIVLIFSIVFLMLSPVISYLKELMGNTLSSEYSAILLKALGIAYLIQISSDICRESGETSIAAGIEIAGKIELIILSFPLISKIISVSEELLSW